MTEVELNNTPTETLDQDYIRTINDLKANSVSKEEYNKLLDESRKLVNQLATNTAPAKQEEVIIEPTADEIRKELFGNQYNNLDYCKLSLALRDAVLKETGEDIFVAKNSNYTPDDSSYAAAERVASVMKECIEYANGDSQLFTNELMRRTNDVIIPNRK